VLAAADLKRLGFAARRSALIDVTQCVPAPGQASWRFRSARRRQEAIDVSAVLNALRTAPTPRSLTDYDAVEPQVPGLASREGDD